MSGVKYRTNFEVVRSGQPRAYADSEYVARITFEVCSPYGVEAERNVWMPWPRTEEFARHAAKSFFGYTDRLRKHGRWHERYLDYFKPIDPKSINKFGKPDDNGDVLATIWEYRTVTPFTD